MAVDIGEVSKSGTQLTTVPFNSLFTELITSVETNGELAVAEVLIKVNFSMEFTLISDVC